MIRGHGRSGPETVSRDCVRGGGVEGATGQFDDSVPIKVVGSVTVIHYLDRYRIPIASRCSEVNCPSTRGRSIINPQIQMLYRGNGFRKFQFEFILTAKSKEESDQISAICNAFIFASSPSVSSASGMFFIPPSVFNIKLMMSKNTNLSGISAMLQKAGNNLVPGLDLGTKIGSAMGGSSAEENTRLFKTGDCVLEDVIVDYAPDGWAAHSGGAPLQTRLTLQFSEIHIVQRERLLKGEIR